MHLGVTIAKEYTTAQKSTYTAGKLAMTKAMSRVMARISSSNLLLKAQAVNSIIGAINNHRMSVYSPTDKDIDDQWKMIRNMLWTSFYMGIETTRHKISQER